LSRRISEFDSETAKEWQKDSSLVVEIETMQNGCGAGSTITARRTVVLGFDHSGKGQDPQIDDEVRHRKPVAAVVTELCRRIVRYSRHHYF
jgi:hypothetical protein